MREIKGYEHPFDIDQRDIITKVIEGRLVPKDLSTFNSFDGDVDNAYVYVDNNGTPAKISLIDISEGMFPIVEEEPKNASINQLVLVKVNESEYKLEKFGEDLA